MREMNGCHLAGLSAKKKPLISKDKPKLLHLVKEYWTLINSCQLIFAYFN